jgi:Conserved hypothetical protein (DUF2461)
MVKNNIKQPLLIPSSGMAFLQLLKKNNNRDWFNNNKDKFLAEQRSIEIFADALLAALKPPPAKKACTVFTGTPVFRIIKHRIKPIGAVILSAPPNCAAGVIIIILSQAIILLQEDSGRPLHRI